MRKQHMLALAFVALLISFVPVSAKLVSTAGNKNITTVEINVGMMPGQKYNVTVTVYEITQYMASPGEQESAAASGRFASRGAIALPLPYAPVMLYTRNNVYAAGATGPDGKANFVIDASEGKIEFDNRGCTEVYVRYAGDDKHLGSQSRAELICKDSALLVIPALTQAISTIYENERLQNACMLFFILIGFLIAGLYASGKDPLRLLDITTPRLPGARKKPEIKISISEDKMKSLRSTQLRMVDELNNEIKTTARIISKNSGGGRREQQKIYNKIMNEISEIKKSAEEKLKKETSSLPVKSAVMVDKKIFEGMYKDIANVLVRNAYENIKDPKNKTRIKIKEEWGENGRQQSKIEKIAEARHLADLISLSQRGPTAPVAKGLGYTGTISDIRRKAEATTGIGYVTRVVDNLRGYVNMAVQYSKYTSKYATTGIGYKMARSAQEKVEREIRKLREAYNKENEDFARKYKGLKPLAQYSDFEGIQKEAERLNITVPITEYYQRQQKLDKIKEEISKKEAALAQLSQKAEEEWRKFEPYYYEGAQMPDIIKTDKVATLRVNALAKEVLNDINHRLFYELKEKGLMTDDEIDKFNGKLQKTTDLVERREKIFEKFRELGQEDLYYAVMGESLYVQVINYDDKKKGFYVVEEDASEKYKSGNYTLQQVADIAQENLEKTNYDSAAFVIGAARAIAEHPIKFEAYVETQEQQLRRYIELDEFVKKDVIDVCVRDGMRKGIEYLMKTEKIEPAEKIRETHAKYIGDEVLVNLWGKKKSKKHERFRGRLESIEKDELSFLTYSEAFKHLLAYVNKRYAGGKIGYSDYNINLVRLHYAREMAELDKRKIEDPEERERREKRIRETAINGILDATKIQVSPNEREDMLQGLVAAEASQRSPESIKKMVKDESLLEAAVTEWSALMALYRATGITGLAGLKQNLNDLSNSAEWEQTCRKVLFERAREFNADKKHLLLKLNTELGNIVDEERAKKMDAEDLLLEIDKVASDVVYKSLMKLFREVSKESAYKGLYVEREIRGKKHIFVKGFVDPTIEETPSLVTLYKKELPNKAGMLKDIIASELASRGISADPSSYAGYYDAISYKYPMLHPGAYPLKDAMHKYAWIQEIGNNFLACPKFLPDYETMGEADKVVNAGVATEEAEVIEDGRKKRKVRRVILPVEDTFARKAAAFISTQGNQFLTGGYIGTMAEAAATAVVYTRHGARLKTLLKPYHGKEGFVKDVTRNEALAEKLLEAYKLRYLLEKTSPDSREMALILKELSPDKIKSSLLDELELIKNELESGKASGAAGMSIQKIDELIKSRTEEMESTQDLEKVDRIDMEIRALREYKDILSSIENIKGITFTVSGRDVEANAVAALASLKNNLESEKKSLDRLIAECKPHVGEYVMQELLNDLVAKSKYYKKENEEELVYIRQEIEFADRVACDAVYKELKNTIQQMELSKDEYGLLAPHMAPPKTVEELEKEYEELMKLIAKIRNDNAVVADALHDTIKAENAVLGKYKNDMGRIFADTERVGKELEALRRGLIDAVSKVPECKNVANEIEPLLASGKALDACNSVTAMLNNAKTSRIKAGKGTSEVEAALAPLPGLISNAKALDSDMARIESDTKAIANKIAADEKLAAALAVLAKSADPATRDAAASLKSARNGAELSIAIDNVFTAMKNEMERIYSKVALIEYQEESLKITTEEKIRAFKGRKEKMLKLREKAAANVHIYSAITPWTFWKTATYIRYSHGLLVKMWEYLKSKFTRAELDREKRRRMYISNGSLVQEVFEYSKLIRERKEEMTEFEKLMAQHARNHAYLMEKFLVRSYGLYATFEAGMHTRKKAYGLNISGEAGHQFAGPMPSTLMQQISTYGRFGNAGWFASMLLAYPIRKAQQTYARRYPLLKLMSGLPAVYEPMKSNTSNFKGTAKGLLTAMLYMRYKHKYARMGEVIRTTAKDIAPRAFFPYLITSNPYGEVRITEILELVGEGFRTSPRGPRDMLNYLLYKPNDIVVDFQDMIYSMKDGRSMKKTPEHLMDVGIYGVVGNSGFIAGREINFINTALGGPESMYQNRAFNMFNYNPQLSMPQMRYSAYGDMYKRMSKPTEIAEEMVHLTHHSHRLAIEALLAPPLILAATYFGGTLLNSMWNSNTMRAIASTSGMGMALFLGGTGAIGMIYRYDKLNSLKHVARVPYMSDEWKTYIKFSERMKNMHMGTYKSEVFYHE
ncbi:MAG: hypothetical protein N3G76_01750 [Candidatus Micrarchaeota archaeon]|nr:hypothetical protein [Candidatus Micrarchaeota archaeon]